MFGAGAGRPAVGLPQKGCRDKMDKEKGAAVEEAGNAEDEESAEERLNGALRNAARCGEAGLIPSLVARGADIDASNWRGHTALYGACAGGWEMAARALLELGADPSIPDMRDGMCALHRAALGGSAPCVRLLLASGAHPDSRSDAGSTPLFLACLQGHEDCARELAAAGADLNAMDRNGDTALGNALFGGWLELSKWLYLAGAKPFPEISGSPGQKAADAAVWCMDERYCSRQSLDGLDRFAAWLLAQGYPEGPRLAERIGELGGMAEVDCFPALRAVQEAKQLSDCPAGAATGRKSRV